MIPVPDIKQMREADLFTIQNEPISSLQFLQRAAKKLFSALKSERKKFNRFIIFCGPGNNGGDGLAIANHLLSEKKLVQVFALQSGKYSEEFLACKKNLEQKHKSKIQFIKSASDFPAFKKSVCIIDALFGSGLSKPLNGIAKQLVLHINKQKAYVVSVDIPSGMFADKISGTFIHATKTLSIQFPKLAFLFYETAQTVGHWKTIDIGIHPDFISNLETDNYLIEKKDVRKIWKPRNKFDHKGKFGHALIIAGSNGMYGAAVLSALACLRSGAGKTTLSTDESFAKTLALQLPECMTNTMQQNELLKIINQNFNAIAIGPGLGNRIEKDYQFDKLLRALKIPTVLDADALNYISKNKSVLNSLQPNIILTPHVAEFDRMFGKSKNSFQRHKKQMAASKKYKIIIVLKGANTCITSADGKSFFNPTGNAGLAKGGSGDVLTGIIVSILAQNFSSLLAAIAGVYLHGLAADIACKKLAQESLMATDVIQHISNAYHQLYESN